MENVRKMRKMYFFELLDRLAAACTERRLAFFLRIGRRLGRLATKLPARGGAVVGQQRGALPQRPRPRPRGSRGPHGRFASQPAPCALALASEAQVAACALHQ